MSKVCDGCEEAKFEQSEKPVTVPYFVYEMEQARSERHFKRLWAVIIVLLAMIFATNIGWLIYESQFETITYEQNGEGINNVNYGEQGDLNNGAESEDP